MRLTRHQLRRIIQESVTLDIEKGDVILTGKFKNKRTVVKDFGTDDLGQPTINGMKLLKFRIEKLMPQDKWSKKSQEEAGLEEGKTMKITKRQLKRIIKEEKVRLLREMIDPEYMREEILSFAETTDAEGMAILIDILEEPPAADLDAAFDIVNKHVVSASPEDLNWIHQEMTSEGLFG